MSLSPEERQALYEAMQLCYRDGEFVGSGEVIWIAAKNYAYEQAAKVCESTALQIGDEYYVTMSKDCAKAIRALKDKHWAELRETVIPMPSHWKPGSFMHDVAALLAAHDALAIENRNAHATVAALILAAGGEVRIPYPLLTDVDPRGLVVEKTEDVVTKDIIFRAFVKTDTE